MGSPRLSRLLSVPLPHQVPSPPRSPLLLSRRLVPLPHQVPSPLPHQIRAPLANTCTWEKEDPLPRDPSAKHVHQGFSNPPRLRSSPVPPTQSVRRVSTLSQAAPPPPSPSVRSVRPDFTNPSHRGAAFVLVVQVINVSPNRSAHQASLPRPPAPLVLSRSVRMYCVKVGALRDLNHGRRSAPGLVVLRVFRVLVHPRGPPRPPLLHVTVGALRDQQCGQ